jgi:integrase
MGGMPKPRFPHVQVQRPRPGRVVYYFRIERHGPRIRLPDDYGSEEFVAAYRAALAGIPPTKPGKPTRDTLAWLIARHRESSAWSGLSSSTRRQRESFYRAAIAASGGEPYRAVTAKAIRAGRERRKDTPAAANNFLKAMRGLFSWAVEAEYLAADPTVGIAFIPIKTSGHAAWTPEDMEAFEFRWPPGTRQHVAYAVLRYTGLRVGDAWRLGRQHVRDGLARLTAEKTGEPLYIPIAGTLAATLAAGPTGDMTFIIGETGKPFGSKGGFANWFNASARAAGLEGKSAHGLRKSLATEIASAGASELELQALFGWRNNRTSSVYTKQASKERLARQAAERVYRPETSFPLKANPMRGRDEKQ